MILRDDVSGDLWVMVVDTPRATLLLSFLDGDRLARFVFWDSS